MLPWAGAGLEAGGGMVCTQTFTCVGANSRARACLKVFWMCLVLRHTIKIYIL